VSCDDPDPCGLGDGKSTASAAAHAAAREFARAFAIEQARLGRAAFDKGDAAFAQGNLKGAIRFCLSAMRYQPDNVAYKKKRALALLALRQQSGGALDELRGADADGEAAVGRSLPDGSSGVARREFDGTGSRPVLKPLPTVTVPSLSDTLARSLGIPLNLNDPANVRAKIAMSQVEYMLKYNRTARMSEGQIAPDPAKLEKSLTDLMSVLPTGTPPLTVEKAEAVFNRYQINLREKK
jgi:tetratricopeptide (TPR) repeat protein